MKKSVFLAAIFFTVLAPLAHADVTCTGTLKVKTGNRVTQLTPSNPGDKSRLTAYAVDNSGAGYTFIADVQGDEVVLKIVPDEEKPVLKHRFKISESNVEVPLSKDVTARLSCST